MNKDDSSLDIIRSVADECAGGGFCSKKEMWGDSEFFPFVMSASGTKGKVGRRCFLEFCKLHELDIKSGRQNTRDANFFIKKHGIVVKFSMLGENQKYMFEQVRDTDYEYLFCLGVSPGCCHVWVLSKAYYKHMTKQRPNEKWVRVSPDSPPKWLKQSGGISDAMNYLKELK